MSIDGIQEWLEQRREWRRQAQRRYRQTKREEAAAALHTCCVCGQEFHPSRADAQTCGARCRKRKQRTARCHT